MFPNTVRFAVLNGACRLTATFFRRAVVVAAKIYNQRARVHITVTRRCFRTG
jgi:hypothetical protein